ncbi:HGxxPAAW family protein [Actinocorallia sp. A-T 12471]|uniref:HGxxPAAW family protein n=1 Tax=Actinocorallia sp. A-T 12471 TaxID=3089813 RepID=UPI0029D0154F|nr:HGxxPAAW family protein [Actinocorallia sp. A-T 12471]MDX6741306.1 HGxxPAAW family protein [Actinocorallia sp. A-T 12471]
MSAGGSHAGELKSWVAVSVAFIGFIVAGFGLPMGNWAVMGAGVALIVVGGVLGVLFRIMADVVVAVPPKI